MIIPVKTSMGSYDIVIEKDGIKKAGELFNLERKVLVVSDSGVPSQYVKSVADCCKDAVIVVFPKGEGSKNIETLTMLLEKMVAACFTRTDCVVAVGGGVVGDISGFAASIYMRGIDFYNIPTTVLSQVDSSIGGKTAINFMGIKNTIGSFYQPKKVLIDTQTLQTLPLRQVSNGLAEAVKMAATSDRELFEIFEKEEPFKNLDTIIERSLRIKKNIVEKDEREAGLRKTLNFGHTLAHAIESASGMKKFFHGECVAMGMLPMCSPEVRKRIASVITRLNLPNTFSCTPDELVSACRHDKKASGDTITVVKVYKIGSCELETVKLFELEKMIKEVVAK